MSQLITVDELITGTRYPFQPHSWPESPYIEKEIEIASAVVEGYLDRIIAPKDITERYKGTGMYELALAQWPVIEIYSVSLYRFGPSTSFAPEDFFIGDDGIIEFATRRNHFRRDYLYEVNYRAGYNEVPADIKRAVALQVIEQVLPQFSARAITTDQQASIREEINLQFVELLEPHRRIRIY